MGAYWSEVIRLTDPSCVLRFDPDSGYSSCILGPFAGTICIPLSFLVGILTCGAVCQQHAPLRGILAIQPDPPSRQEALLRAWCVPCVQAQAIRELALRATRAPDVTYGGTHVWSEVGASNGGFWTWRDSPFSGSHHVAMDERYAEELRTWAETLSQNKRKAHYGTATVSASLMLVANEAVLTRIGSQESHPTHAAWNNLHEVTWNDLHEVNPELSFGDVQVVALEQEMPSEGVIA